MLTEIHARAHFNRIGTVFAVIAALTLLPVEVAAQAPSVTATPTTVAPGGTFTVTVANGPANPNDWVTLGPASGPDTTYLAWKYLTGSTVPPPGGLPNATLQLVAPMTPGTYTVRLFANDSWVKLATSSAVTVVNGAPGPTVTASPASVSPGGVITATVANGPGNPNDWVTLSSTSATDSTYLAWKYLTGSTVPPPAGLTNATLQFVAPMDPGTYNLRFFANDTWVKLATSNTVTVGTTTTPTLTINNANVPEGNGATTAANFTVTLTPTSAQTVTVAYATANGTATAGNDYVAATGTLTFAPGVATRPLAVSITGDTTTEPDETFVVMLSSPTNAVLGSTQGVGTIVNDDAAGGGATVTATPASVAPGGVITVTVANGPANPNDWVTLGPASGPDTTYLAWKYLNGSTVPPPAGLPNATLQLVAPMTPGTYTVRLFANDSWVKLATSSAVTVVNGAPGPTVTTSPASVSPGDVITVTVANGPGNPNDWVTLSSTSATDSTYLAWKYLTGSTTPPATGMPNATLQFVAPMTLGTYNVRLFANDSWVKLATSAPITVNDTTPPLLTNITTSSITAAGATITWTTNEGSDSQVDHGLTTAYGSVSPLNGSLVTAHSVIVGALAANTTYHFRVRSKDSAGNLAVSGDFTFSTLVLDLTAPVVSITAPANNATVSGTVTFSASATDNVGVTGVEFKRNGTNVAPEDTAAPYTVSWDTTTAAHGVHTLTAMAWDAAGNQATATRTVTVSNPLATVQLAWDPNTEADLAGYRVKVGTSSGVYSLSDINVGNVTSYTVTDLPPGTVYYFAVTAVNLSGAESGVSNEVSATR